MIVVKWIFWYLKGTQYFGLWYEKKIEFDLKVYIDADKGDHIDERKIISGGEFLFGERIVSWINKKHNCISQSTAEAEHVATVINFQQVIWIKLGSFSILLGEFFLDHQRFGSSHTTWSIIKMQKSVRRIKMMDLSEYGMKFWCLIFFHIIESRNYLALNK